MASSTEVITAFKGILRRDPEPGDFAHYAAWPVNIMIDSLAASSEANSAVKPAVRMYQSALGRKPDTAGLDYWVGMFRSGSSNLADLAAGFLGTLEGQLIFAPTLSNLQFVERLYTHILGRTGDIGGIQFFVGQLNASQTSRAAMLANFSESSEAATRYSAGLYNFLLACGTGDPLAYDGALV